MIVFCFGDSELLSSNASVSRHIQGHLPLRAIIQRVYFTMYLKMKDPTI